MAAVVERLRTAGTGSSGGVSHGEYEHRSEGDEVDGPISVGFAPLGEPSRLATVRVVWAAPTGVVGAVFAGVVDGTPIRGQAPID
ncbi:hypothetical protein [Salinigranum salinum]|uniref:hypothetical protein n=1 Tax=Salinigranum salinum TaxID=1364937 RepID=UPI0018649AD5|nr:hypothetical protein [Salinigranum salinum]